MLSVIVYGGDLVEGNAYFIEAFSHPCRVGIHHLPNEQLISDCYDFCFHNPSLYTLHSTLYTSTLTPLFLPLLSYET